MNVIKRRGLYWILRLFNAKYDKERIAGWKSDLNKILHIFNVRSIVSVLISL